MADTDPRAQINLNIQVIKAFVYKIHKSYSIVKDKEIEKGKKRELLLLQLKPEIKEKKTSSF